MWSRDGTWSRLKCIASEAVKVDDKLFFSLFRSEFVRQHAFTCATDRSRVSLSNGFVLLCSFKHRKTNSHNVDEIVKCFRKN